MIVHTPVRVPRLPRRAPQVYVLTGGPTDASTGLFASVREFAEDLMMLFVVVLCLPLVIIGVGLPIALLIRGVLWIAGWL